MEKNMKTSDADNQPPGNGIPRRKFLQGAVMGSAALLAARPGIAKTTPVLAKVPQQLTQKWDKVFPKNNAVGL